MMAQHCMLAGTVALWFFRGPRRVLLRNPIALLLFRGSGPSVHSLRACGGSYDHKRYAQEPSVP